MKKRKKILVGIAVAAILTSALLFWMMPFLRTVPFPVPDAATCVRYKAAYVPGPGGEEWTRFNLPAGEALLAAETILNEKMPPAPIKHIVIDEDSPVSKLDGPWWFTPHRIKNGTLLYRDTNEPFSPSVWIDGDNGTVYQHMSD